MKKLFALIILALTMLVFTGCSIIGGLTDKVNGGDESLDLTMEQVQTKMNDLAEEKGYYMEFECKDEDGTYSYKLGNTKNAKWGICYENEEYSGYGFVVDGEKIHIYEVNDDGEFEYSTTYESDEYTYLASDFNIATNAWIYYGYIYNGALTKLGSTKVAGRNATEYEFNLGASLGAIGALAGLESFKYKFAIDNELGITLKLEAEVKADGEDDKLSYEVKTFKVGNVTVPTFPEPEEEEKGEDPEEQDQPTNNNKYALELSITSEYDLYCIENVMFVAQYTGSKEDLENSVYIDDLGAANIYFVWVGFYENGDLNKVSGYTCLYYFFNTEESYLKGVSEAGSWLRGKNDSVWYLTYNCYDVESSYTYEELISNFNEGNESRYVNFTPVESN